MTEEKTKDQMAYEDRLRRRLKILKEQFQAGKVRIAEGLRVEESLLAVREGPDGEIDLDTVDGLVRSMALVVTAIHDREELKKSISLGEIQNLYFKFIENNFGHFYKVMISKNLTPHDVGKAIANDQKAIEKITENQNEFLSVIEEFWESYGEVAHIHVEDMQGNIKGIFGGDLFPSHNENIASKCGIYTDTIVLPDPFLRSRHIFKKYTLEDKAYYFTKHAMNILQYKDLACADVDIPIVVILPNLTVLQHEEREFCSKLGQEDSLIHTGKLFGRKFGSFEELIDFAQSLDTIEKAVAEISDEKKILFDTEWYGDTASQIKQFIESDHCKPLGIASPGMALAMQSFGRMSVSNELLVESRRLNGIPIIDAPTSWQYLVWKMEYDSERAEFELKSTNLHVVKGLQDLASVCPKTPFSPPT